MDALHGFPSVLVLGEVAVVGARGRYPVSPSLCRETVAYLALCRGRGRESWTEALMPGRRSECVGGQRNNRMTEVRRWLGTDRDGTPFVPEVTHGLYDLDERVITDWQRFLEVRGPRAEDAALAGLVDALRLVRGRPFAGVEPGRWEWAVPWQAQMSLEIATTARELIHRAAESEQWEVCRWAAEVGLVVSPLDERLWEAATDAARRCEGTLAARRVADRARTLRQAIA